MKHLYPLPALILCPLIGSAQSPVLDFSTNGTLPGDAFTYQESPWLDPGPAGMDQIWDLSGLISTNTILISFVDPSTTPATALFPSATIAADNDGSYAYSAFTSTGGQFLGIALMGVPPMVYSDPMQWVAFPATYGTTWTDPFHAEYDWGGGSPAIRDGSITGHCDAYGTLQLPWGTLTDVLRATYVEDYVDDFEFYTSEVHKEYTHFMQAGTRYPIVHIYSVSTTTFGSTTVNTGTQWMPNLSTGIAGVARQAPLLTAIQDPATNAILVNLNAQENGTAELELIDMAGVMIERHALGTVASGPRTERLGERGLAAGLYLVRLRMGESTAVCRVVLQ